MRSDGAVISNRLCMCVSVCACACTFVSVCVFMKKMLGPLYFTPLNEFLAVAVLSHVYWLQSSINDSCQFHLFPPSLCEMLQFLVWRVMAWKGWMWTGHVL